ALSRSVRLMPRIWLLVLSDPQNKPHGSYYDCFLPTADCVSSRRNLGKRIRPRSDQLYWDNGDAHRSGNQSVDPKSEGMIRRLLIIMMVACSAAFAGPARELKLAGVPALEWDCAGAPPRAMLLCLHGLGLHKGVYDSFA